MQPKINYISQVISTHGNMGRMKAKLCIKVLQLVLISVAVYFIYLYAFAKPKSDSEETAIFDWTSYIHKPVSDQKKSPKESEQVLNFSVYSNNITGFPNPIVPNIVHLIKFRTKTIDFVEMVNIKSIVDHHGPDRLLIHCGYCVNKTMEGKYWDMLGEKYLKVIEVVEAEEPTEVFGKNLSSVFHASDVARINILMKYGGIYLDNDIYVVQGLHGFRYFEMALGWDDNQFLGTQVLFAHKDARFLRYWLDSYHNYQGDKWYFNAGEYPTTSVLFKKPELVHRVKLLFGVQMLIHKLYKTTWPEWTSQYTIHLLIRHRSYLDKESPIKNFDEENIKTYNFTYGQMARMVLYGKLDVITTK